MKTHEIVTVKNSAVNPAIYIHFSNPEAYLEELILGGYPLPGIFSQVAEELISPQDTVLDLGCGPGFVGQILRRAGHEGRLIANDASLPMLEYALAEDCYDFGYHGDAQEAVDAIAKEGEVDWAVALNVCGYLSPERLAALISSLSGCCRKGMIMSFECADVKDFHGMRIYPYPHDEAVAYTPEGWQAEMLAGDKSMAVLLKFSPNPQSGA